MRHRIIQYIVIITLCALFGGGYYQWHKTQAAATIATGSSSGRADFEAPLTTSLELAAGTGTPTYSRADGADRRATVTDFEGLIRPVKNGEARFEGARRVENLLAYGEDLGNAVWNVGVGVSVNTNIGSAPDGTATADRVNLGSNAGLDVFSENIQNGVSLPLRSFVGTLYVKGEGTDIGKNIRVEVRRNTGVYVSSSQTVALTGSWQRISTGVLTTLADTAGLRFYIGQPASNYPASVLVWGVQLEEVTGQANQNPSEYVSTNVKTAFPYHGAGVDGVKYFDYQNGNTVASAVVTEAKGTAIPSATLRGYLAEGARTNITPNSEAFESWSFTPRATVSANTLMAPDGRSTADKVVEDTTVVNTHYVRQVGLASAGTVYSLSVYAKAGERTWLGLGTNWLSTFGAYFNLSNGTVGTIVGGASASIQPVGNGWYRCTISGTWSDIYVDILMATGDNGVIYTGDGTSGLYLWGAQLEQALFASSYIPTTTASVARASDSLSYPEVGNMNNTAGSLVLDVTPHWTGGSGHDRFFIDDSSNSQRIALWHWGGFSDGLVVDRDGGGDVRNNVDSNPIAIPLVNGTGVRLAMKYDSAATKIYANGSLIRSRTSLTLPYDALVGRLYVGRGYYGLEEAYSTIKNVRSWKQSMSDTFLNHLTAGQSGVEKKTVNKSPNNTGLVGAWNFEEGSGTKAEDVSPTGTNTGTLTNGPTWTNGKVGKALSFDGVDDYVDVGNAAAYNITGAITVSAWIKVNQFKTPGSSLSDAILEKWDYIPGSQKGYSLRFYDGNPHPMFVMTDGTNYDYVTSTTSVTLGAWTHVMGVWTPGSGNNLQIYVNGVVTEKGNNYVSLGVNPNALYIGRARVNSAYFDGAIDEVRIYNKALSSDEITSLYQQSATTKINASRNTQSTNGLVGLWSFNGPDVSGTTAYDRSGQGNNGTLINGPTTTIGKLGQAMRCDGVNDFVRVYDASVLNPGMADFTMAFWLKVDGTLNDYMRIVEKQTGSVFYAFTKFPGNQLKFEFRDGVLSTGDRSFGASSITVGSWEHVAAVVNRTSGTITAYLNGAPVGSSSISGYGSVSTAGDLKIGQATGAVQNIDEFRMYNRALSDAEITDLYNQAR